MTLISLSFKFTGKPVLYIQRYIVEIFYDDIKSKAWTEEEINKRTLRHSFYILNNITNFKRYFSCHIHLALLISNITTLRNNFYLRAK